MGAGSLADAAQSLAEGATEQAGAVQQQLQATITNITSMVDSTAEHTKSYPAGRHRNTLLRQIEGLYQYRII